MNKKSKLKQIVEKYYGTSYGENRRAKFSKICNGCGWEIPKGTYYIDLFVYKSLWYKFHHSTICRAKGAKAICILDDPSSIRNEKLEDVIQFFDSRDENDSWQNIIFMFGFLNSKDVVKQLQKNLDLESHNNKVL